MPTKRILELDYMKGIAIVMVVIGHVLIFSIGVDSVPIMSLIGICEMPFFFAVSGFLSYKYDNVLNIKDEMKKFIRRSRMLLVPLVVWSLILNIVHGVTTPSLSLFLRGDYWFFIALWLCDLIYAITSYVSHRIKFSIIGDILLYGIIYTFIIMMRMKDVTMGGVLPIHNIQYYFPFFVLGIMMRKYVKVYGLVLNRYSYAVGMLVLIMGWYFSSMQSYAIFFCAALGAVVVTWMACREIKNGSHAAKVLALVGQNTLPIFAIHYLFIAKLPLAVYNMTNVPMGFIFQFIIAFVYAIVVVVLCLGVDRIISMNVFTRMFFFGESKKREWRIV